MSNLLTMKTFQIFFKISRHFCTPARQRNVQVCILGADTMTGVALSAILKQNPVISGLHLQGTSKVESMAADLNHFDTRSKVRAYSDCDSVSNSVKSADIIVILGLNNGTTEMSLPKLVMAEGTRVTKLAESCAKYSPKAIVVVAVIPVSVTLPIVAEIYKDTVWYHPGRLLGSAALPQVKANALAARYQTLDPQIVQVPIIGGPDIDCAIPLFANTTPEGISQKNSDKLFKKFREETLDSPMSHAVGINRLLTGIALGIRGDHNANILAYIRTNVISNCKHLVCTLKMGKKGVIHNYGLPKLRRNEIMLLEETTEELKTREEMASDFVHRKDKNAPPKFMLQEMEKEKSDKLGIIR